MASGPDLTMASSTSAPNTTNSPVEKPFACHICPKRFALKHYLWCHLESHKDTFMAPYLCTDCSESFVDLNDFKIHLEDNHPESILVGNNYIPSSTGLKPRKFTCPDPGCKMKFSLASELSRHAQTHTSVKVKPFGCPTCGCKFSTEPKLLFHQSGKKCQELLAQKATTQYKCKICDTPYKNRQCLSRHNRTMHGIRVSEEVKDNPACVCLFCGHVAKKPCELERHNRIHTGEKPYTCPGCQNNFKTSSNYHAHLRNCAPAREMGILPGNRKRAAKAESDPDGLFPCSLCNFKAKRPDVRKNHEAIHGTEFHCQHCGVGYKTYKGLQKHQKEEHLGVENTGETKTENSEINEEIDVEFKTKVGEDNYLPVEVETEINDEERVEFKPENNEEAEIEVKPDVRMDFISENTDEGAEVDMKFKSEIDDEPDNIGNKLEMEITGL